MGEEKDNKHTNDHEIFLRHEQLFCECYVVSCVEIDVFFKENPGSSLGDLQKCLGVGTGCGSCLKNLNNLGIEF